MKENESNTRIDDKEKKNEEDNNLPPVSLPSRFLCTTAAAKLRMVISCAPAIIRFLVLLLSTTVLGRKSFQFNFFHKKHLWHP